MSRPSHSERVTFEETTIERTDEDVGSWTSEGFGPGSGWVESESEVGTGTDEAGKSMRNMPEIVCEMGQTDCGRGRTH